MLPKFSFVHNPKYLTTFNFLFFPSHFSCKNNVPVGKKLVIDQNKLLCYDPVLICIIRVR